jgi:hypothetical protein
MTGIGLVEEMPISAIPLFVASPQVLMNQERNFYAAPRLEEEETGTGITFFVHFKSFRIQIIFQAKDPLSSCQ